MAPENAASSPAVDHAPFSEKGVIEGVLVSPGSQDRGETAASCPHQNPLVVGANRLSANRNQIPSPQRPRQDPMTTTEEGAPPAAEESHLHANATQHWHQQSSQEGVRVQHALQTQALLDFQQQTTAAGDAEAQIQMQLHEQLMLAQHQQLQYQQRIDTETHFQHHQIHMDQQQQQQQRQWQLPLKYGQHIIEQEHEQRQPEPQFFEYDGELYNEAGLVLRSNNRGRGRGPLTVRFASDALLHHSTRLVEDIPPLWYTRDDLAKFKRERKAIVRALKRINFDASRIDQSVHSLRGLEAYQSISYNKLMQAKREQVIKIVLQAQERCRAFHPDHVDDELLREESIRVSEWARERALELGRADAMELGHTVPPLAAFEAIEPHMDDDDDCGVLDHESVPSLASTVASMDDYDIGRTKEEEPLPVPDPKTRIRFDIFADLENDDMDDYDEDIPLTPVPIALMQLQAYCDSQISSSLSTNLWKPGPVMMPEPSAEVIKRLRAMKPSSGSPATESKTDENDEKNIVEEWQIRNQLHSDRRTAALLDV